MYELARAVQERHFGRHGPSGFAPDLHPAAASERPTVASQLGKPGQDSDSDLLTCFASRQPGQNAFSISPPQEEPRDRGSLQKEILEKLRALTKPCEIEILDLNLVDPDPFQVGHSPEELFVLFDERQFFRTLDLYRKQARSMTSGRLFFRTPNPFPGARI